MNRNILAALALSAMATPLAATATPITYGFTGQVIQTDGSYSNVPSGATVTGTFTIDYDNAFAPFTSGTVGTDAGWTVYGGSDAVFSSNIQVGGITYATASAAAFGGQSYVTGGFQDGIGYQFLAQESFGISDTVTAYSGLQIIDGIPTYTAGGQPTLSATNPDAVGFFGNFDSSTGASSDVDFEITSATPAPVPVPAAVWLLLSGLGSVGLMSGRRRVHPAS